MNRKEVGYWGRVLPEWREEGQGELRERTERASFPSTFSRFVSFAGQIVFSAGKGIRNRWLER